MDEFPKVLSIDDLYPYECCAVQSRYQPHYCALCKGKPLDPVEVTVVECCYLVTNGCNRVKAAKDFGLEEVPVKERASVPDLASMKQFKETLQLRQQNGQRGFAKYDIVESDEERNRRTHDELGF